MIIIQEFRKHCVCLYHLQYNSLRWKPRLDSDCPTIVVRSAMLASVWQEEWLFHNQFYLKWLRKEFPFLLDLDGEQYHWEFLLKGQYGRNHCCQWQRKQHQLQGKRKPRKLCTYLSHSYRKRCKFLQKLEVWPFLSS